MQLPFLMPMFDNRSPYDILPLLILSGIGLAIAFLWIRRIAGIGEGEYRSFRATVGHDSHAGAGLVIASTALLVWLVASSSIIAAIRGLLQI